MVSTGENIKLSFNRNERLKSRTTIDSLFIQNRLIRLYPFKLVWLIEESEIFQVQAGVSVSKRIFKNAVQRNKIKRRMREAYRLNKMLLYQRFNGKKIKISFMLIYVANEPGNFKDYDKKIKQLLIRLGDNITREIE